MRMVTSDDLVLERVGDLLSMQLGADQVLVTVKLKFRSGLSLEQIESIISRLKQRVQQPDSVKIEVFIEPATIDDKDQNKSIRPAEAA